MRTVRHIWLVCCLTFGISSYCFEANAQIFAEGLPESFLMTEKAATLIPVMKLDSVNTVKLKAEDRIQGIDNRYGMVRTCNVNMKEAGVQTKIPGKGTIWRYRVESDNARSLGLFFSKFHLPSGAKVFIYNASKVYLRGAFTSFNNSSSWQLPIAEFPGKNLIIEYFEPSDAEFSGELILGSVSQAYRNLVRLTDGRIGINCEEGNDWQIIKHAVCLMTFHDLQSSYFCTGTLMNNVKEDETPYFLTANHCINSEQKAATLVTYFNYENSTCDGDDANFSQTLAGATLKAGSQNSDFSLLLLNELPPDEYNPYFAGWDVSGANPRSGACIHHPDGYAKCIALANNTAFSYPEKIQWFSEDLRLISTTLPDTHWNVLFTSGLPENGSSGGPLFDQNKRVVGQLHGGVNSVLLFGKLSLSWNYIPVYEQQLAYWLDPTYTRVTSLDGIWKIPPKANFSAEIQEVCVNSPIRFFDQSSHRPTEWHWQVDPPAVEFANGTDSSSQNPEIVFLTDGAYSIKLRTANKYGSDERTAQKYILARSKLDVRLNKNRTDTVICGCDLKNFQFTAGGAVHYQFSLDRPELIDTVISKNNVLLTLNPYTQNTHSFDTWLKVTGTNGNCTELDSILLHVVIQPNDDIANATNIYYGSNTGFSNHCATEEPNEPYPPSSGCIADKGWCPDLKQTKSLIDNSVWFKFVAPENGMLSIGTSGFDNQIAVYEASGYENVISGDKRQYMLVAANDNRSAGDKSASLDDLELQPGKQYWLQVDGNNASFGDFSIDLISHSLEAVVFPNPSTGNYNLNIFNPEAGMAEITVTDLSGRMQLSKQFRIDQDSTRFTLDLSNLRRGIYLLRVKMNGKVTNKKLIRL